MTHDVVHREPPQQGALDDRWDDGSEDPGELALAGEKAGQAVGFPAVGGPSAARSDRDHTERPAALGEFQHQCAAHRITHQVRAANSELVQVALHDIARGGERVLVLVVGWPAQVPREGGRNDFEVRDQVGHYRPPLVPGAHEAVQQHERLALSGAIKGGGDLGPMVHLESTSDASAAPVNPFARPGQTSPVVTLDREQVLHVARLARLELTGDEVERMQRELSHVLDHIEKIRELDLEGVPPTSHVVDAPAPLRPDQPEPCLPREAVLASAPEPVRGGFGVPSPGAAPA